MIKIAHKRGDTLRRTIVLNYQNGTPVNLTGVEVYSQMRDKPGGELKAEAECAVDIALGRIMVTYSAAQVNALEIGHYGYDIRVVSEGDVQTIYTQEVEVIEPYTEVPNA